MGVGTLGSSRWEGVGTHTPGVSRRSGLACCAGGLPRSHLSSSLGLMWPLASQHPRLLQESELTPHWQLVVDFLCFALFALNLNPV